MVKNNSILMVSKLHHSGLSAPLSGFFISIGINTPVFQRSNPRNVCYDGRRQGRVFLLSQNIIGGLHE